MSILRRGFGAVLLALVLAIVADRLMRIGSWCADTELNELDRKYQETRNAIDDE